MRNLLIAILLAGSPAASGAGLYSGTGAVIAIMAGELFVGEAEGHLSGAGTLSIRSKKNPALMCFGQFASSSGALGAGRMQCTDGATGTFSVQRLSVWRGHGAGSFSRGSMSFAYGLGAAEARSYLKLPEGKRLSYNRLELELVDL